MVIRKPRFFTAAILAAAFFSGCGYTTKSMLPEDIKRIHVAPVKNAIDLTGELSDDERFRVYRPGLEVDLTNAIINRFIFDGNLKISGPDAADAVVETKLVDFHRDPLRYDGDQDVQEYRLNVVIDVAVVRADNRKVLWHENVVGDATFFLQGPRATSEDQAVTRLVEDAARRVVEKTIELW